MALSRKAQLRLGKLIDFMASLPKSAEKHFNMSYWFSHDEDHSHAVASPKGYLRQCGTTACALGWAATDPYFQRIGIKAKFLNGKFDGWGKDGEAFAVDIVLPAFDIDRDQYLELFERWGSDVDTPKGWARRARQLVKEWSAA